jgi:asparagine N-glycosylation enzyme membrane subunit Stt3
VAYEVRKNPALRLVELFLTPLSLLLLGLATLSWLTGETGGAVVIAIMVVLATVLSFTRPRRAFVRCQ